MKVNKKSLFKNMNPNKIMDQLNQIQVFVFDSRDYFVNFENYLNDKELSDKDKLICIRNQYLEFISKHSILDKKNE